MGQGLDPEPLCVLERPACFGRRATQYVLRQCLGAGLGSSGLAGRTLHGKPPMGCLTQKPPPVIYDLLPLWQRDVQVSARRTRHRRGFAA